MFLHLFNPSGTVCLKYMMIWARADGGRYGLIARFWVMAIAMVWSCYCLGHGRGVGFGKFFCFKQSGAVVIKCWLRGSGIGFRSTIVAFAYAWLFFRVLFRSALALS